TRSDRDWSSDVCSSDLKLFWVFEKFDQFLNFFLGLFNTGHVFESRPVLFLAEQARLAFAEAQGPFAGHLELADQEKPDQRGQQRSEERRVGKECRARRS